MLRKSETVQYHQPAHRNLQPMYERTLLDWLHDLIHRWLFR